MKFGITLSNRGVLVGLCTTRDLLALTDAVEAAPVLDLVWCGDALFVNRRLDALTLLAAVAGRTERVLLGPACMGSFALRDPLVFAYEWASLLRALERPDPTGGLLGAAARARCGRPRAPRWGSRRMTGAST